MFKRDEKNGLVFIKSKYIKVFPCGRRRSTIIDPDKNNDTVSDQYYLPFDPEARLNTEANHRKHSGMNGYKQSYINYARASDDNRYVSLSFVIAGYLFDMKLEFNSSSVSATTLLGETVMGVLNSENTGHLYANIKLADIEFFSGVNNDPATAASTTILRDQHANSSEEPLTCLDVCAESADALNAESYYFYGLSFSNKDLSADEDSADYVSLCLLDYSTADETWAIHEASRLPKIDHGDTENSVKIDGDLEVTGKITQNGKPVITAAIVQTSDTTWQLQFANVEQIPLK